MAPHPLVAGNWKMNGRRASLKELAAMGSAYDRELRAAVDLLICPPATLLIPAAAVAIGSHISLGAQDCHAQEDGAYTGDLSAEMLADAGATYVIVGHSERRLRHCESNETVRAKALAAARAGLTPIVCVGETLEEHQAGRTLEIIGGQVADSIPDLLSLVVAYEPIWAIGTGLTPSAAQISAAHGFIRSELDKKSAGLGERTRILYGGSVKPSNARDLLSAPSVDGALVGGASLCAAEFMAICDCYRR